MCWSSSTDFLGNFILKRFKRKFFTTHFDWAILLLILSFISLNIFHSGFCSGEPPIGTEIGLHYINVLNLKKEFLTSFNFQTWNPAYSAGSPSIQFYPPLTYIVSILLSFAISLPLAFKLVAYLACLTLPIAIFTNLKLLKFSPLIVSTGLILSIFTLYHNDSFMFGGNIHSILIGEFSFAWANAFFIVFLATLYLGITSNKYKVTNIILLSCICLLHPVTLIIACLTGSFFLITNNQKSNLKYLFCVYLGAFLLTAWWTVPFAWNQLFTGDLMGKGLSWRNSLSLFDVFPKAAVILLAYLFYTLSRYFKSNSAIRTELVYFIYSACTCFIICTHPIFGWAFRFSAVGNIIITCSVAILIGSSLQHKPKIVLTYYLSLFALLITLAMLPVYSQISTRSESIPSHFSHHYEMSVLKRLVDHFEKEKSGRLIYADNRMLSEIAPLEFSYLTSFTNLTALNAFQEESDLNDGFTKIIKNSLISNGLSSVRLNEQLKKYNINWIISSSNPNIDNLINSKDFFRQVKIVDREIISPKVKSNSLIEVLDLPIYWLKQPLGEWKKSALKWFSELSPTSPTFVFSKNTVNEKFIAIKDISELPVNQTSTEKSQTDCITNEKINDQELEFQTNCIGKPHLIKVSYYPNWKVTGADEIFLASPGLMLIIPKQENIRLYYGTSSIELFAQILSYLGLGFLVYCIVKGNSAKLFNLEVTPLKTKAIVYILYGYVGIFIIIKFLYFNLFR